MKRTGLALAALTGLATLSAHAAPLPGTMTVRTFLAKVARLKSLGPLAIASSDLAEVKGEARAAALGLKQDSDARKAAGKPPIACPPDGTKLGSGDFLAALELIPSAERDVPLKDGFARIIARRYPCARKA